MSLRSLVPGRLRLCHGLLFNLYLVGELFFQCRDLLGRVGEIVERVDCHECASLKSDNCVRWGGLPADHKITGLGVEAESSALIKIRKMVGIAVYLLDVAVRDFEYAYAALDIWDRAAGKHVEAELLRVEVVSNDPKLERQPRNLAERV